MDFLKGYPCVDLNGVWSLAYAAADGEFRSAADVERAGLGVLPATVPGNLELDLQAAGLLDDPFVGLNMLKVRDLERCHVWMWRCFDATAHADHDALLIFEGVDCYADVYLNGAWLSATDNMLVEHVFDVSGHLRGENELFVHIRPAVEEARQHEYGPGVSAMSTNYDSLYVRKAPHMYGWDIMPRALSAGLWRSVKLIYRPAERLEYAFLETQRIGGEGESATLRLNYRARLAGGVGDEYSLRVEGVCGQSCFAAERAIIFEAGHFAIPVQGARLWWPVGRGQASLYDVEICLLKNGHEIDSFRFQHGIRTVRLERSSTTSAAGEGEFCFVVNGERVFALGTNWVPLDAFHSRDLARVERALDMVQELGCNMIRCWGGNVYESDLFFEICDRKGIMVWQDFAMACAIYPQDVAFQARLAAEARKVVRRLRQHPSLVLWAGDNECDVLWAEWYGRGDPNQNVLTRQLLPQVLREEDPARPYLPSSPTIDSQAYQAGSRFLPENHLWGPRDYYKSEFYGGALCHFVSEIGYHGCPAPDSLRQFLSPDKVWPWQDNAEWTLHCTNGVPGISEYEYRVELMARQIRELFGQLPEDLLDYARASQFAQAEALKFFIEFFRVGKWRRTGILWWNLLDGWPQFSDAIVDYTWRKKLAYSFVRRAQQPVCLILCEPEGREQSLVACNDTREDVLLEYCVRDVDADESVAVGRGDASADAVTRLARLPFCSGQRRFYVLEWRTVSGSVGRNHYVAALPPLDLYQYREWLERAGLLDEADYAWMHRRSD